MSLPCRQCRHRSASREFRYDSGRARYLSRVLDSDDLEEGTFTVVSQVWSDFDGDETYGDYSLTAGTPPTATNLRSYQPGLAEVDEWVAEGADNTNYLVTDHLGTVRDVADDSGLGVSPAVFTAFGERISGDNRRHGYVGAFGYQSHSIAEATNPDTAFPFLHVGERYYDPSSGRFLQRDPVGVFGGLNVYSYAGSRPTIAVDPSGETVITVVWGIGKGIYHVWEGEYVDAAGDIIAILPIEKGPKVVILTAILIYDILKDAPDGPHPPQIPYQRFFEDPNPAIKVKPHAPSSNCMLNPGLPCRENPNCPNYCD